MIEIRRARVEDEADLSHIDAVTCDVDVSPSPPAAAGARFFEHTRPDDVLVAEVGGQVAGYVQLRRSIPLPSQEHVLEIGGLAVDPNYRGTGLGRRLVDEAAQEARRRGATKLSLRVLAPNRAARRVYDSCGFEVEGVLRGEFVLGGQLVDDVLMARRLN